MSVEFTPAEAYPELIFGLVGPIGTDLDYTTQVLTDYLRGYSYDSYEIKLSSAMQEIYSKVKIDERDLFSSYNTKIDYANDLRKRHSANDIMAAVAIGAIKERRERIKTSSDSHKSATLGRGRAYIIRQLKTPEEIILLRRTYSRQFIQISVYLNQKRRETYLIDRIKIKSNFTKSDDDAKREALALIDRDKKEEYFYGQNISDCFPLGDLFLDYGDKTTANNSVDRFLSALFGNNEISPTRDEYGMYLAKSASLASSDLSRQVGAAVIAKTGELISLGSNEVPKAGGGPYWTGDPNDARDFKVGVDQNQITKSEVFGDLLNRLFDDGYLSHDLMNLNNSQAVMNKLFSDGSGDKYRKSRVMDIIEFGRMIHAEMSAICDAARVGSSVYDATMFVTTFPCHICAKHIVASGIKRLVYLEPYPKSYTEKLHSDSVQTEDNSDQNKVHFTPFMGISPFRYRDLFEKGKRKNNSGEAAKWQSEPRRPIIEVLIPQYLDVEKYVIAVLANVITAAADDK